MTYILDNQDLHRCIRSDNCNEVPFGSIRRVQARLFRQHIEGDSQSVLEMEQRGIQRSL